jgi:phosphopantothenoylcysteine decarboxylase / phosphopantothenate---cysteine ligase
MAARAAKPGRRQRQGRSDARPRVLLGVTGGIAAYKSLELVRLMKRSGWDVTAVMTRAARRFVGPESFRALTGNPVALDLFPKERPLSDKAKVTHVDLASSADIVVIAPATANIIGKLASGIADDLLSTILLAVPRSLARAGRVLFAPAMNTNMWSHPSVTANVARLGRMGYRFVAPGSGELACGTSGPGRMAEPAVIFAACSSSLAPHGKAVRDDQPIAGRRVVVTAGRTEEPLDPARIITNRSSGRMGVELARAFAEAGANTTLIAGALSVPVPSEVKTVSATTAESMRKAVLKELPRTDVLVMCAAVADYRPARVSGTKRHDAALTVVLERTPDILKAISETRHHALVVGFSLDNSTDRARAKLRNKQLDLIVANPFKTAGADTIAARLLFAGGRTTRLRAMPKPEFARRLVDVVAGLCPPKRKP